MNEKETRGKTYRLTRAGDTCLAFVERPDGATGYRLPHIVRHSPTGFEWGYMGSRPADLARCILIDLVGVALADKHYQEFKSAFIAPLPEHNPPAITEAMVREWLGQIDGAQAVEDTVAGAEPPPLDERQVTLEDLPGVVADSGEHSHCLRCKKPLRAKTSRLLGYGPRCAAIEGVTISKADEKRPTEEETPNG